MEGEKRIYEGYRGLLEEELEGEVIGIRIASEVWKREQKYYGLHKGEVKLVEKIEPEDTAKYNFKDLTVKLIIQLNIKK